MPTESKKLWTDIRQGGKLYSVHFPLIPASSEDKAHDARIAHEQREELLAAKAVIRQLHAALNEYYLETVEVEGYSDASTRALLALAAPFLLED